MKLRNFALQKLAEEKAEEGDETASSPNDQKTIKYYWRSL